MGNVLMRRAFQAACVAALPIIFWISWASVSSSFKSSSRAALEVPQAASSDLTIAGNQSSISLPFDLIDNRIIIDMKINGRGPLRFIFDSGAVSVISAESARELGLKMEGTSTADGGVGENRVERGETRISEVAVGDLRLTNQEFGVISFADTKYVFGSNRIDGIIGYPLFKRLVVKIDYEQRRLTFTRPEQFSYKGKGMIVPLDFDGHLPLVNGKLDGVPGIFVIDTGARSALILYGPFVEKNNLRA